MNDSVSIKTKTAEPSKPKQACQDYLGRSCEGFKARSRIKTEKRRRKGTANEPTRIGAKSLTIREDQRGEGFVTLHFRSARQKS